MNNSERAAWSDRVWERYHRVMEEAAIGTGSEKISKLHASGKLTARERINLLFDKGTFKEFNMLSLSRQNNNMFSKKHYYGDGVIIGYGKVCGRTVFASSSDVTISGGAGGEEYIKKICHCMEQAIKAKVPFISLNESGGARIEEGIDSLAAYSTLFKLNTMASGYIPQIAVVLGNCAGGASYSPILHDFIFVTQNSQMYITGPQVIEALTGEHVTMDELGGSEIHCKISGQAQCVYTNEKECIMAVRELLSYIPQNCMDKTSLYTKENRKKKVFFDIEKIVPENTRHSYDIRSVINEVIDDNSFFEIHKEFAKNICVGFARLDNMVTGIIANQPQVLGGAIDCDAADKAARFVRFCDCFNIPLITFVDVPAFLPGKEQEKKGIIRHGAKLLYSFAEATVPKVTIILRKAYGGAYCAMNSKNLGADIVYAWPICEIAVMGAEGAVNVIGKKEIANAEDPNKKRQELINKYNEEYLTPYYAATHSLVDEVIKPNETRERLIEALDMLKEKELYKLNKKHGNIPL